MKLVYIINSRFPTDRAHGTHVIKMCEAFASNGAEVELIVPDRFNHIKMSPYEYYNVVPNDRLKITKLPALDLVPWHIPLAFIIETISFSLSCARYIRKTKPEIIYTRGESILLLTRLVLKRTALFWETHIKPENMERYQKIFSTITGFVTVTKLYEEELVSKYGVAPQKIITVPDGIDKTFFETYSKSEARKELGLPKEAKVVMYMGLFEAWKGAETLFQTAKELKRRNIIVAVAGGTEREIKKLKEKYPDVVFLGFTEYRRQPKLQQAADILVVPNSAKYSMSTHYTSPLKVFAHMASGIPVVASDLPSLREVLNDNNATFFIPDNPDSLTEKILFVFDNYNEAKKKAEQTKLDAKQYLWTERAKKIIDFIRKVR